MNAIGFLFFATAFAVALLLYIPGTPVSRWLNPGSSRDTHGKSRWATTGELRRACVLRSPDALHPAGVVLGWWGRRKVVQSLPQDNVLVVGVSRSGKTSSVVIPTLLSWKGGVIATSTKAELVRLTGPYRKAQGHRVGVFAPLEEDQSWITELGLQPVTWNPIASVRFLGHAAELADVFTADGVRTEAAHWYQAAASVLAGVFMLQAQRLRTSDVDGDMLSAWSLLCLTAYGDYPGLALEVQDEKAKKLLSAIASTPDREAGSIISTARTALSLWMDERIAAATRARSENEFDVSAFIRDGGTLYLVAPVEEAERCRSLFSALLQTILRTASARAQASLGGVLEPRLLLALDEVANFVRIPRLPSYVSTGPGQGIQALLCYQDLAQLETGYGHDNARSIINNCRSKLLMPGQGDLGTLETFSRAIGDTTVYWQAKSWNADGKRSSSEQRITRPLAAPEVLRMMNEPVLIPGDGKSAKLKLRGWWEEPRWRDVVGVEESREPAGGHGKMPNSSARERLLRRD